MVIFCNKVTDKRLSKVSNLTIIYSFYFRLLMLFLPFPECTFWDMAIFFKHLYELMFSLEIIRDGVGSQPPPV